MESGQISQSPHGLEKCLDLIDITRNLIQSLLLRVFVFVFV